MRGQVRSTLPPQAAFYYAILRHLVAHPDGDRREAILEAMPGLLNLSETQRTERLANLPHLRYRHRSGFGLSELKKAGYVESPERGLWRITTRGRELVAQHPDGFTPQTAKRILREYLNETEKSGGQADDGPPLATEQAPEERIDAAVNEISLSVAEDLLDRILKSPPDFFEHLVLDLLHALGYGASEDDLQRTGGPGDEGFDGVISLDKLGLERVYVQAKRWQGSVGRPDVQAFYGALSGRRARKGVFITTSAFTREAREFGARIEESVVLIDGDRLAKLMIRNGVGVTHRTLRLARIDAEYFEMD